ncbi:hypothetical protein CHUAL_009179 [Chamberlinius hualienensis]
MSFWNLMLLIALYLFTRFILTTLDYNDKFSELQIESLELTQLQNILESRGISHFEYKEKKDLMKLVSSTGGINHDELSEIISTEHDVTDILFESEEKFLDEVVRSNEDVWLILTQQSEDIYSRFLDNSDWEKVKSILKPAGIKTGILYCHSDSICKSWKWNSLILKTTTGLTRYPGLEKPSAVIEWVRDILKKKVMVVEKNADHKYLWEKNDLRMILVLPPKTEPPIFYLTLSASLSDSISFGIAYANHACPLLKEVFGNSIIYLSTTRYLVSTPNFDFEYGEQCGEHLNFYQMRLMLNTLQPRMASLAYISLAVFCLSILPEIYLKYRYCNREFVVYILELIGISLFWCICGLVVLWLFTIFEPLLPAILSLLLNIWRGIATASRIWVIPNALTTTLMVLCICWYKVGHKIPNFVSWIQKMKNKIFSLDNEYIRSLNTSNTRNLDTSNDRNLNTSSTTILNPHDTRNLNTSHINDLNHNNMNDINNVEINVVNTEQISIANTRQINVANTEQINVANTGQINVANTEQINIANAEQMNVANTEQINVTNTEQINIANTEQMNVANTEQINVTNTEQINVANAEQINVANAEQINVANAEQINVANTEHINDVNNEHIANVSHEHIGHLNNGNNHDSNSRNANNPVNVHANAFLIRYANNIWDYDFNRHRQQVLQRRFELDQRTRFQQTLRSIERLLNEQIFRNTTLMDNTVQFINELPEWSFRVDGLQAPERIKISHVEDIEENGLI